MLPNKSLKRRMRMEISEIIVRTQKEWDNIPKEFDGYIYIQNADSCIIVAERKGISVVARGSASVVARDYSSVVAGDNASVEAWEHASVVAGGNVQIIKDSDCTNLKVRGNARIVTPPDTVQEYCDFYGITIKNDQTRLYKAVKSDYSAFHDSNFKYKIGETFTSDCNDSREKQCSFGLHVSHIDWALNFGRSNNIDSFKILECAVPIDKIIVPKNSDGKIRTSELTVLREVPLEECGVMGKIILKQREKSLRDRLCAPRRGLKVETNTNPFTGGEMRAEN